MQLSPLWRTYTTSTTWYNFSVDTNELCDVQVARQTKSVEDLLWSWYRTLFRLVFHWGGVS